MLKSTDAIETMLDTIPLDKKTGKEIDRDGLMDWLNGDTTRYTSLRNDFNATIQEFIADEDESAKAEQSISLSDQRTKEEKEEGTQQNMENRLLAKLKSFTVGSGLGGKEILEYEDDYFYIPSSPYCVSKLFDKYPKIDLKYTLKKNQTELGITIPSSKLFSSTIRRYTVMQSDIFGQDKDDIDGYIYKLGDAKYIKQRGTKPANPYPRILFCHISGKHMHIVYQKKEAKWEKDDPFNFRVPTSIFINLESKLAVPNLEGKEKRPSFPLFLSPTIPKRERYIIVWDTECFAMRGTFHKVYMSIGAWIDLDDGLNSDNGTPYAHRDTICEMLDMLIDPENMPHTMMDCDIDSDGPPLAKLGSFKRPIQMWAHNSKGYEAVLLLNEKEITPISELGSGGAGGIKELKFRYKNTYFKAKDSLSFLNGTLDHITKNNKIWKKLPLPNFNIGDITPGEVLDKHFDEITEYCVHDVMSLAETLIRFNKMFEKSVARGITTTATLSSMSFSVWNETSNDGNVFVIKDPIVNKFIRRGIYGGRVIHNKMSDFDSDLICLDANSLYPSAMAEFKYPIGSATILGPDVSSATIKSKFDGGHLGLFEVTMCGKLVRHPIVPHRVKIRGLVYPCNEFTGVYCTPDIVSALAAGYTISNWKQCVYWNKSGAIFKEYVNYMYEKRLELKASGDEAQVIYKDILNSLFGKFNENITNTIKYEKTSKEGNEIFDNLLSDIHLACGRWRAKYKVIHETNNKPRHIAAFILGYSRLVMNKLWNNISPGSVAYGDTDSVYISTKLLPKVESLLSDTKLGYFKNDYGNGTIIDRNSIFLDYKRYALLTKPGGKISIKFNGLSFPKGLDGGKNNRSIVNGKEIMNPELLSVVKEEMKKIIKNPKHVFTVNQAKWRKIFGLGVRIDDIDMIFGSDASKKQKWKNGVSYPYDCIDFDTFREFEWDGEFVSLYLSKIKLEKFGTGIRMTPQKGITTAKLPVTKYTSKPMGSFSSDFPTSFTLDTDGNLLKIRNNIQYELHPTLCVRTKKLGKMEDSTGDYIEYLNLEMADNVRIPKSHRFELNEEEIAAFITVSNSHKKWRKILLAKEKAEKEKKINEPNCADDDEDYEWGPSNAELDAMIAEDKNKA